MSYQLENIFKLANFNSKHRRSPDHNERSLGLFSEKSYFEALKFVGKVKTETKRQIDIYIYTNVAKASF